MNSAAPSRSHHARPRGSRLTTPGALRVPEVAVIFWVVKLLSTAMGESTSDGLVNSSLGAPVAVVLGFIAFLAAIFIQFKQARYRAWSYWLAVCAVGVFGTMAADVMHKVLLVPYAASSAFYAVLLAAVFISWGRIENTLSIHSIDTPRRESFYWAAVVATFAMGTALGDFTANTLKLGYLPSAALFAGIILIPLIGWRLLRWNEVFCFWAAYVVTRPLGASIADGLGKPKNVSGMGLGDWPVSAALAAGIVILVAYLTVTKSDVQKEPGRTEAAVAPLPQEQQVGDGRDETSVPATTPQW